jgi:hypothetical protein
VTGFLKLCLHTRCIQDLFKTIYNPLAFLSPSLFGESFQKEVISSESAWNETLSDDSSGIHVLLRSTGFGSCQASENGLLTQLKNKTNEINQTRNFSVCRLLNFLFKHFLKNKKSRNVQQDSMNSFLELAIKQPRAGRALNRYKFLLFFNCTLFSQTVWWREIIVCVVKGKERRKK